MRAALAAQKCSSPTTAYVAEKGEVEVEAGDEPLAVDSAELEVVLPDELRRVGRRRAFSDAGLRVMSVVHEIDAPGRRVAVHIDEHVRHDVPGLTAGDRLSCGEPGTNAVAPAHRLAVARRPYAVLREQVGDAGGLPAVDEPGVAVHEPLAGSFGPHQFQRGLVHVGRAYAPVGFALRLAMATSR